MVKSFFDWKGHFWPSIDIDDYSQSPKNDILFHFKYFMDFIPTLFKNHQGYWYFLHPYTPMFIMLSPKQLDQIQPHLLFVLSFDDLFPVNNFSVMSGLVFLGWTSTKQRIKCRAQGHNTVTQLVASLIGGVKSHQCVVWEFAMVPHWLHVSSLIFWGCPKQWILRVSQTLMMSNLCTVLTLMAI